MSPSKAAGIIVIGNEVLSGKVSDINSTWLISELRELGQDVARVVIVPDEIDVIAEHVAAFARLFDPVFTTGGVGPTHDDKTFAAVAAAFGRPLEPSPELERIIREYFGAALQPVHLRMAQIPRGTTLVFSPSLLFPVTRVDNVWVFPGDPTVLRRKFTSIRETFRRTPIVLKRIYTKQEEGSIAGLMADVEGRHPGLAIGSYPVYGNADFAVQITVESRDPALVDRAMRELLAGLDPQGIVKVTP